MVQQVWYKQFWPWFLITLPVVAVIASFYTLTLAMNTQDSLVVDDYYNKGKAINEDISRLQTANNAGIQASLYITGTQASLNFDKGQLPHYPALKIYFYHPTLQDKDLHLMINADYSGTYRFVLPLAIQGKWYVSIEPFDKKWRLQTQIMLPSHQTFTVYGHT
ncbi:MAG: FixH family protein [Plesiomonas sp.]|uniref:FixH family protein n=1 Tax=Plesiomonas sp. TaxID=2486279 RepID=UPI003F2F8D5D